LLSILLRFEIALIPGEMPLKMPVFHPKTMSPRLYVPKCQIARRYRAFLMSLSGNWLILVDFKTRNWMPLSTTTMADPQNGCHGLGEDFPDWKDGLLQDPGV
jgi:hypothetical protein